MSFPDSPRVIYEKNPLIEVICQLRFPAILRIDSELPAEFQERLRERYPIFGEIPSQDVKLNLPPDIEKIIGSGSPMLSFRGKTSYEFVSEDQLWKIQLTREALTIFTADYKRWEDFKEHLTIPLDALVDIYKPAFYTRIGLRYKDLIQRSELNLVNEEWSNLLRPHIAAELSSEIAGDIIQCANQLTIRLEANEGQVLVNHGLVSNQENEICYLIDSDFSNEQRTEVSNAFQVLDSFNRQSGRLFRWCITDRLHEAMHPQHLPESVG
jgi:uncharacterized protein (TIGR04255 family)